MFTGLIEDSVHYVSIRTGQDQAQLSVAHRFADDRADSRRKHRC